MAPQDKNEGMWEQAKGKAQKAWGDMTDDEKAQAEGKARETKGKGQEKAGEAKEWAEEKTGRGEEESHDQP